MVTGGSLSQFPAAWHKAREEVINSSHWWLGVITASQLKQFTDGTGVKTRGTGEGILFKQGEKGAGEFLRKGGLLRTSFSGIQLHFLRFEGLSLSFVTKEGDLREKLLSQEGVAF